MHNSMFKTVATVLAALALGASVAAAPSLAAVRHDGHGGAGQHAAAGHRDGRGRDGARYAVRSHGGGGRDNGGDGAYHGGCYDQRCNSGPGIVGGIIDGALGAVGGY
jgi:hypothetical protein